MASNGVPCSSASSASKRSDWMGGAVSSLLRACNILLWQSFRHCCLLIAGHVQRWSLSSRVSEHDGHDCGSLGLHRCAAIVLGRILFFSLMLLLLFMSLLLVGLFSCCFPAVLLMLLLTIMIRMLVLLLPYVSVVVVVVVLCGVAIAECFGC
jgi:hypothetical protein